MFRRRFVALLTAALLAGTVGCAAFIAAIPTVAEIVADGANILGMIETAVTAYFADHPNPAQQAIAAALQKTHLALQAGEAALDGLKNVTAAQQAAAFADFATAYGDLMALVAPLGIISAQPVSHGADGGLADAGPLAAAAPVRAIIPLPQGVRAARGAR